METAATRWVKERLAVDPEWRNKAGRKFGGDNWRGRFKAPNPSRGHPVVVAFFKELNAQLTTVAEVSGKAGLHAESVRDWATRKMPRLDNVTAALNALDLDIYVGPRGLNAHDVRMALAAAKRAKETPQDEPAGRVSDK